MRIRVIDPAADSPKWREFEAGRLLLAMQTLGDEELGGVWLLYSLDEADSSDDPDLNDLRFQPPTSTPVRSRLSTPSLQSSAPPASFCNRPVSVASSSEQEHDVFVAQYASDGDEEAAPDASQAAAVLGSHARAPSGLQVAEDPHRDMAAGRRGLDGEAAEGAAMLRHDAGGDDAPEALSDALLRGGGGRSSSQDRPHRRGFLGDPGQEASLRRPSDASAAGDFASSQSAGSINALASGLGLPAWQWDQPALESKGAGPEAITLDDLRPNGRSFSQLHYLIGLGLVADDLS